MRLAQHARNEQLRVAWVERSDGLASVQIARWFHDGADWQAKRDQITIKLYELLAVRKALRAAHARRRPPELGAVIAERWLGRGRGRRLLIVVWTELGVAVRLGASAVSIDRASLCHVFEALDIGIALGRSIEDSALARLGAGWDDPVHEDRIGRRAKELIVPNERPLMNAQKERPNGRAAVPASRPAVQTDLFGEAPAPKKRAQPGPGGRIAAAFYNALDAAGLPHVTPVWARDVKMANDLIKRVGGEATAEALVKLAIVDPWLSSRDRIDFGCFLRICESLRRVHDKAEAERREREHEQRLERDRHERIWNSYLARYGRRHPDDPRTA